MGVPLVSKVAIPRFHIVGNEMFARCNNAFVLGVESALQTDDQGMNIV